MKLGNTKISKEEAEKEAEKELRFNIGNLPHLGEARTDGTQYIFPIKISLPQVIFENTEGGRMPVEVNFLSESEVGEIVIDGRTGEEVQRTKLSDIEGAIKEKRIEVELAVQKALIKSVPQYLSELSYVKHRKTPALEILSEIIVSQEVSRGQLESLNAYKDYTDHLTDLKDAGLVYESNNIIRADDKLKQIKKDNKSPSDRLSHAFASLLEANADNMSFWNEFLTPHLTVAGYYYRRAVLSSSLPEVTIEEFRRRMEKEGSEKKFQASRYLLELEQVGLLKVKATDQGERVWVGYETIVDDINKQDMQLSAATGA